MKVAQIQFLPWDKLYNFDISNYDLNIGDQVVVKTELGVDIGKIIKVIDNFSNSEDQEIKPIVRRVTTDDLNKIADHEELKEEALKFCKTAANKNNLPIKIVDVYFSLDGGRLTFAFIADGRIDFRQLVKDLTHHFQKSIRLHQLGIRDEAKMVGDIGSCGRRLCCKTHLKELDSITSEMAEVQQISHRGSSRLSGMCGRLHCCLSYELAEYEKLAGNLPKIGSKIKTSRGKGRVIAHHILKQTVNVEIEGKDGGIIEVPIKK